MSLSADTVQRAENLDEIATRAARPPRKGAPKFPAAVAAIATLAALGLWTSFHYARAAWGPDPDIFVTIALWRGFRDHGLSFFGSWSYTQDNWLFSLVPIACAVFAIFGTTAKAALALGWGFFIASAALAAWITARIAGRTTAMLLGCVLLFASYPALGPAGYLAYPISHGVSMAWGLAAIALALRGFERRSFAACGAAAFAVFLNAVSDPWAGAAVALPIMLASAGLAVARKDARPFTAALAGGSLVAFVCARTRLFGALAFLPPSRFELTDLAGLLANVHWGVLGLAGMFNIVPGAEVLKPAVRALDVLGLAIVLGGAAASAVLARRRLSLQAQFVSAVSILSIAAVGVLFLAGRWDSGPAAARFFPNVYFLGAVLLASQATRRPGPRWGRVAVGIYAVLFVLAGVASRPELWLRPAPVPQAPRALALGEYLAAQGLAYGYGPFWGTQALAMAPLTEGRVTVRPVSFRDGQIRRRPAETSSFWFRPEAEPSNARIFLVVIDDGEECPNVGACEALAVRQFGPPAQRLQHENATVLVWDHPLAAKIAP